MLTSNNDVSLTTFTLRPDRGGSVGRKIGLKANIFPVTALAGVVVYHYHIVMLPELPPEQSRQVFRQCEVLLKKCAPDSWFVYDGVKNAYSTTLIPDLHYEIVYEKEVNFVIPPLPQNVGIVGGQVGRGRPNAEAPSLTYTPLKY